ncbi:outer membrane protein TolC [Arcticibacter pallidicorallinus]|uniref:Outer membrane protein TolC n=1 Tax=Arcticibacter pallidicorallinus TaxID=1259464 RepID=A0A2T0U6X3_9SPHI|nr:TolC family protein [Arcticibacter pallidicorallinus]PRY53657.1 outer membrane protein TolC [Arcticibacter pallidicorallinus]
MKSKLICILSLIFSIANIQAQEVLTLESAIRISLENNYNIRITRNQTEIDRNNVSLANAGILPVVGADLVNNRSIQETRQTQADGSVREVKDARNSNLNYGIGLDWTIFDGFAMFANYDRLKELQKLGETNMKATILNTVSDVVNNYYYLIRLQKETDATDTAVAISRLRLNTAENRYKIGKAAKLEVLNATVDLNTDTTNLLRLRDMVRARKIILNELLARDVNTDFAIRDSIVTDPSLKFDQLLNLSSQQNPVIQTAFINERIARLNLKQVKATRYPTLGVNTGYNFTRSHSELGFARDAKGQGFTYGLTASVNIFNGFLQKRNEKNAEIQIENAQLDYNRLKQNITAQLSSAYQTYLTNLQLVDLERSNQNVAKQNMDITLAKFRLGSVTPVEFREAQRNYLEASVRFTDSEYQAKQAEIALKELAGNLTF